MKLKNAVFIGLLSLTMIPILENKAFAQASVDGGGRFQEADIKIFMGELSSYFKKPESRELFTEVDEWEKKTNPKGLFSSFIESIEPKVVDHKVYGPFNEERDCVSKHEGTYRYFECNSARLPENRLENQGLLYVMILHEAFVHAGIEPAGPESVPSHYPVSSRIGLSENLHKVVIHTERYVPGSASKPHYSDTTYLQCHVPSLDFQFETLMLKDVIGGDLRIYENFNPVVTSTRNWNQLKAGDFEFVITHFLAGYDYEDYAHNRYGFSAELYLRRVLRDYDGGTWEEGDDVDESRYMTLDLDLNKSFVSTDGCQMWVKGKFQISNAKLNYSEFRKRDLLKILERHEVYCTAPMVRGIRHRVPSMMPQRDEACAFADLPIRETFKDWSVELMRKYKKYTRDLNQ